MTEHYQAYVDGSGTGDPDLFVLAGYIASASVWEEFSKQWKARLAEANLKYFKMYEMSQRTEIAAWFYRLIEEHDLRAAISCTINVSDLTKVCAAIRWPARMTNLEAVSNPYYFAFRAVIDILAQYQGQLKIDAPVDFIFDEESEKANTLKHAELIKINSAPEFAKLMGGTPIYLNDKSTMPLQAADLYAWWVRKWEREKIIEWGETMPFAWSVKKNIPRLTMSFSERDFWTEYSRALAKISVNFEELKYAESIFPV
jgi:hypothetical protein